MNWALRTQANLSRIRTLLGRVTRSSRKEKSQRAEFYRDTWAQAATEIGATVDDSHGEVLLISRAGVTAKVFRNYTDLDGPVTLRAAGNKPLVHETLRSIGIRTPDFLKFSLAKLSSAEDFLRTHEQCVVKPASGTGAGAGVTTNVQSIGQLRKASILAAGFGSELLIENQVAGRNVRLLLLDGQLLDAVERRPPCVVGDGRSTVAQLVRRANQVRLEQGIAAAQVFLRYDLDMQRTLSRQDLSWRAVPKDGQEVRLKTVINDNAASDNVSVMEILSEQLTQTSCNAARAVGVRLAGVDLVTPDLTLDLVAGTGVVLEINTAPGLYIHKGKQGKSVAVPILEACLEQARSLFGHSEMACLPDVDDK